MKERPIIFSTEMVKAILDGRKTQTRRAVKPELKKLIHDFDNAFAGQEGYKLHVPVRHPEEPDFSDQRVTRIYCPYGQVGDRLWVKETWATESRYNHLKPSEVPDTAKIYYVDKVKHSAGDYSLFVEMGKVRSAMFMCKWMPRITLEITGVRVERLQEITEEDALKEGMLYQDLPYDSAPVWQFKDLWDSLNAKRGYGWDENPWVWVLKFDNIGVRVK